MKAMPYLPAIDLLKTYGHIEAHDDLQGIRETLTGKLLSLEETRSRCCPPSWHSPRCR